MTSEVKILEWKSLTFLLAYVSSRKNHLDLTDFPLQLNNSKVFKHARRECISVDLSRIKHVEDVFVESFCSLWLQRQSAKETSLHEARLLNYQLKKLNLSECKLITNRSCALISISFPRLETLNLSFCSLIDDRGFQDIMKLKYLVDMNIRGLYRLNDESLLLLADNVKMHKKLKKLDLRSTSFSSNAFIYFFENDPGVLVSLNLSHTNVNFSLVGGRSKVKQLYLKDLSIGDSALAYISSCRQLTNLDLSACSSFHDTSISQILFRCRSLEVLSLAKCNQVTDDAFETIELSEQLSLINLNLSQCKAITSSTLIRLAKICGNLQQLYLVGCPLICDEGMKAVAKNCPYLEILDISAGGLGQVSRIGSGVYWIGRHCPSLKVFRGDFCKLNDKAIISISKGCSLITEVSLKCMKNVSDIAIRALSNCKYLQRIDLSSCKAITDDGVIALVRGCSRLLVLDLSNTLVTDESVLKISKSCHLLKSLVLRNCFKVTERSVSQVLTRCLSMERFDVGGIEMSTFPAKLPLFLQSFNIKDCGADEKQLCNVISTACKFHKSKFVPLYDEKEQRQYMNILRMMNKSANVIVDCFLKYLYVKRSARRSAIRNKAATIIQNLARKYIDRTIAIRKALEKMKIMNLLMQRDLNATSCNIGERTCCKNGYDKNSSDVDGAIFQKEEVPTREFFFDNCFYEDEATITTNCISNWRLMMIRLHLLPTTKCIHVKKIQRIWRLQVQSRARTLERIKVNFRSWSKTFVKERKAIVFKRLCSAIMIQRWIRVMNHEKRSLHISKAIRARFLRRRRSATIIANFVTSRFRRKKVVKALKKIYQVRYDEYREDKSASFLQTWFRRRKNKLKQEMVQKKWMDVSNHLFKKSIFAALNIFKEIMKFKQRNDAALLLSSWFKTVVRKHKLHKLQTHRKRIQAVRVIQSIWSAFRQRIWYLKYIDAVKTIQRIWRTRCKWRMLVRACHEKELCRLEIEKKAKQFAAEKRIQENINNLIMRSRIRSAVKIQNALRQFLRMKREQEKLAIEEEEKLKAKLYAEERLNEIIRLEKKKKSFRNKMKNVRAVVNFLPKMQLSIAQKREQERDTEETKKAMLQYHMKISRRNRSTIPLPKNPHLVSFRKTLLEEFEENLLWSKQLEYLSYEFLLWPNVFHSFFSIWNEVLDLNQTGFTHYLEFFHFVREPQSDFADWIFPHDKLSFASYTEAVVRAAMLSKQEAVRIMFNQFSQGPYEGDEGVTLNGWEALIDLTLSVENLSFARRLAVEAFGQFASKNMEGVLVLHFDDFERIVKSYPFLIQPFLRLLDALRKKHLSEKFWRRKKHEIAALFAKIKQ